MMSYKTNKDSFGGLLSEVSSIDTSLFDKKSLKESQMSKSDKSSSQRTTSSPVQSASNKTRGLSTQSSPQNRPTPSSSGPVGFMQKSSTNSEMYGSAATGNTRASAGFDVLIGDFPSSRHNRPMRPTVKSPGVANTSILDPQSASVSPSDHAGRGHDDLDDIFHSSQTQAPGADNARGGSSIDFLEGFGSATHKPSGGSDPFDVFNSAPQKQRVPLAAGSDDLLGGFEGTLGVEDHSSPREPVKSTPSARVTPANNEQEDEEDEFNIFAPTPSPSTKAASVTKQDRSSVFPPEHTQHSPDRPEAEVRDSRGEDEMPAPGHKSRMPSTGDLEDLASRGRPYAEYSRRTAERDRPTAAEESSEAGRMPQRATPSRFPRDRDERPETASQWQSQDEGTSNWQAVGAGGKDSAKEWLDKGQKWLFTAGKKVAAAAKEASSTIQNKLDEMEVFKASGKGPRTWSPDDDDMMPEYYRQWASTIERLAPEEQARTLGAMSEDDRLVVQRIIDQSSVRRSTAKRASPPPRTPAQPHRSGGSETAPVAVPRQAPPRPPQRTRSAETLPQPSPAGRAASGGLERPQRSSSYNLGTASNAADDDTPLSGSAAASPDRAAPVGTPSRPPARGSPSPQRPAPAAQKQADLLGLFGGEAQQEEVSSLSPQPAASSRAGSAGDLFDMSDIDSSPAQHSSAAQRDDVDILGIFASAAPAAACAEPKAAQSQAASTPAKASKPAASGLDELFGAHKAGASMIDFGDEASDISAASAVKFTAPGDVEVEGEPEIRRQARARRMAEKQAQIQAALAEKQARDSAEASEKERKVQLREQYKERMHAWQQGKDGNIRALLASLDTVLWENSGWKKPPMTDLLEPARVKRAYMKANLVIHPDKVKQKGGTVEQIVIADIAFDALKNAWGKFEAAEMR